MDVKSRIKPSSKFSKQQTRNLNIHFFQQRILAYVWANYQEGTEKLLENVTMILH